MAPNHTDMLKVAQGHDQVAAANAHRAYAAGAAAIPLVEPAPIPELNKLTFALEDEDPFNGNLNNRRVAERIARMPGRKYLNQTVPTHIGDPNKAASDVQKSKSVNPDIIEPDDDTVRTDLSKALKPPTPGSPAALKVEQENAAAASTQPSTDADAVNAANAAEQQQQPAPAGTPGTKPPAWKPNA